MIKKSHRGIGITLLVLFTATTLFGCGAMGNEDTPEITPQYLEGDYAQQLMNDGAEKLLGSIALNKGDSGDIEMILHPKEIVEDDTQAGGFRIDSFALNRTFVIPDQAYITFLPKGESKDPQILTPSQFYTAVNEEYKEYNTNFSDYGDHKLYDVYALDSQVLLILARYIE